MLLPRGCDNPEVSRLGTRSRLAIMLLQLAVLRNPLACRGRCFTFTLHPSLSFYCGSRSTDIESLFESSCRRLRTIFDGVCVCVLYEGSFLWTKKQISRQVLLCSSTILFCFVTRIFSGREKSYSARPIISKQNSPLLTTVHSQRT